MKDEKKGYLMVIPDFALYYLRVYLFIDILETLYVS
jgi:hypothetical protein